MRHIKVFQLGDVHLPDHPNQALDHKDPGFSPALLDAVQISPLRQVVRELQQLVGPADAVIVQGDLTSRGDIESYALAVDMLFKSLSDPLTGQPKCSGIFVVPGNHDINRPQAVSVPKEDLVSKFEHMTLAWGPLDGAHFEPQACSVKRIPDPDGQMQVVLLNSCIGCGEPHGDDGRIKAFVALLCADYALDETSAQEVINHLVLYKAHGYKLEELHDALEILVPDPAHRERAIDQFPIDVEDTPLFRQEDLEQARLAIAAGGTNLVSLVVAHHPVLPQELPRVALYPELVNAGQARSMFMASDRSVVYLHGHTHSDPVEEVRRFRPTIESFLTVGVPELKDGFNVLEFQFSDDDRPLGVEITFMGNRGGLGPSANLEPVRVQLSGARNALTGRAQAIYQELLGGGLGPYSSRQVATQFTLNQLDANNSVLELEWHGRAVVLGERRAEVLDFRLL